MDMLETSDYMKNIKMKFNKSKLKLEKIGFRVLLKGLHKSVFWLREYKNLKNINP